MYVKNDYIEGLDIPQSDKELLYKFEDMDWADIRWWDCQSEKAQKEARYIMQRNRRRDEHSCGID